jgi:hypothetical protein
MLVSILLKRWHKFMKALNKKIFAGTLLTSLVLGSTGFVHTQVYADSTNALSTPTSTPTLNQPGMPGAGRNAKNGFQGVNIIKEAAILLETDESTLSDALKAGTTTLLQLAVDKDWTEETFLQKLVETVTASIDAELAAGTLTQLQADQQKTGLSDRLKQQIEKKGFRGNPSGNKPNNGNNTSSEITLTDIKGNWAVTSIQDLVNKGILQGDQNKHFNPNSTVSREELATMVAKSFNLTSDSTAETSFSDVAKYRWSFSNVEATKDYFEATTNENGTFSFNPTEGAKRADVAVTLVKVLLKQNTSLLLLDKDAADKLLKEKFKDADRIPVDLRTYVATAVQSNLIQGDDKGNFAPTKTITRAEIAALLDRLLTSTAAATK